MPINPFNPRVQGLDLPPFALWPSAARATRVGLINNLASLGENYLCVSLAPTDGPTSLASAGTDEQGNVDQGKAIAALARAGSRDAVSN